MKKNGYFDTDSVIEKAEKIQTYTLKQKVNTLYGICNNEPCDVEIEIHGKLNTAQLIGILTNLADIINECELAIHINN